MRLYKSRKSSNTFEHPHRSKGFTLIEVMIVLAIIGILMSIALPSLQAYVWKARRNEAFLNLNGIYKSQMTYMAENGVYGPSFDDIGFAISGGSLLNPTTIQSKFYTYTLETFAADGVPNSNYSAVATGDLDPNDDMLDIIMIESGVVVVE